MQKKFLWIMVSLMLILSACGNEEKASKVEAETKPKTEDKEEAKVEKEDSEEKGKSSAHANGELNPAIAEETEGNVEVVYTNNKAKYTHDMNGVSVDGYEIAKVTDVNESSKMWFDDQLDGYVISAK